MKPEKLTKASLIKRLDAMQLAQAESSLAIAALEKSFRLVNKELKAVHEAYKNLQASMDEFDDEFWGCNDALSDKTIEDISRRIGVIIQKSIVRFRVTSDEDKHSIMWSVWAKFNAMNGANCRDLTSDRLSEVFVNIKRLKELIVHRPEAVFSSCNWWKNIKEQKIGN